MSAKRPAPRKSTLSGVSPVQPRREPPVAEPASEPTAPAPSSGSPHQERPAKGAAKKKVGFYLHPEDKERIDNAILHTAAKPEGSLSLSEFMEEAARARAQMLEDLYNDGAPFDSVGRTLPRGRAASPGPQ